MFERGTHEAGLTLEIRRALVRKTPPVPYSGVVHAEERIFAICLFSTPVLIGDERRELPPVQNRLATARIEHRRPEPNDGPSNGQDERHRDG
jgi:hypothetical protein